MCGENLYLLFALYNIIIIGQRLCGGGVLEVRKIMYTWIIPVLLEFPMLGEPHKLIDFY